MIETITLSEIKMLYEEMNTREAGDSYFTKWDGTKVIIDTGYAFEGIELFIEELEHMLKEKEEYRKIIEKEFINSFAIPAKYIKESE